MNPQDLNLDAKMPRPAYGGAAWRRLAHEEYVGPWAFEVSTSLARMISTALRTLATLDPEQLSDDAVFKIERHVRRRTRTVARVARRGERVQVQVARATALETRRVQTQEDLFEGARSLEVTMTWLQAFHAGAKGPGTALKRADQLVTALLAHALMGARDGRLTEERDRLVTVFAGDRPRRLMLVAGKDERSPTMRARWEHVRRLMLGLSVDGHALVTHAPEALPLGRASDHGPFRRGVLEVWRVSHLVFEEMEDEVRRHKRDVRSWKEQGGRGTKPELSTKGPASRGATAIDPRIFFARSTRHVCARLAAHVHLALNPGTRPLKLSVLAQTSGASVQGNARLRWRHLQRTLRAALEHGIGAGVFGRPKLEGNPLPLERPTVRGEVLFHLGPPERLV